MPLVYAEGAQPTITQVEAIPTVAQVAGSSAQLLSEAGIKSDDSQYVDFIVNHEGGWDGATKWNHQGSGAYGICQALPGTKMASAGADWATNTATQLRWCDSYAKSRYGSWQNAYNWWIAHNWW